MKEVKREWLFLRAYYDHTGISKHLEEMAAKGWMLESIGSGGWKYHRIEPRQLRFSVTYFSKATRFDPGPSEALETFRDLCAEAGWVLAADSAQMQVFYNEDPNAVPIETDPSVQLNNMHQAMKRSFLASYWALLALSLFEVGFSVWKLWKNPVDEFSSSTSLIAGVGYVPMLILVCGELLRYYLWRRRAKAEVEAGKPLPILRSARMLSLLVLLLVVAELAAMFIFSIGTSRLAVFSMVLMMVFIALMILVMNAVSNAMKRLHFSSRVNRLVTYGIVFALAFGMMAGVVALALGASNHFPWLDDNPPAETYEYHGMTWDVYHDDIPLRIEDLMDVDYDEWSTEARQDSSFLLTHTEYDQQTRLDAPKGIPDLSYEIVDIHAGFLYSLCKQDMITQYWYNHPVEYRDNYLPVDPTLWNADEVYQLHNYDGTPCNYFLICWPNRIAEIHFYWDPTPEQIAIAAEKLKNA